MPEDHSVRMRRIDEDEMLCWQERTGNIHIPHTVTQEEQVWSKVDILERLEWFILGTVLILLTTAAFLVGFIVMTG